MRSNWRLFEQTAETIKDRNADTDSNALIDLIDTIVSEVRRARAQKPGTSAAPL